MRVVTLGGGGSSATVAGVRVVLGQAAMYNLTVARDHTYAVGASHAVVHNVCPPGASNVDPSDPGAFSIIDWFD